MIVSASTGCSLIVRGGAFLDDGGGTAQDGGHLDGQAPDQDGGRVDSHVPNRPPLASGVGLSNYRPIVGEELIAYVGPTYDPDGNNVAVTISWARNGTTIAGMTSTHLVLDASRSAVDDQITVTVSTNDGQVDGSSVTATATIVADTGTRWNMLQPPRDAAELGTMAFDVARQRVLFRSMVKLRDHGLWERQLTVAGAGPWSRIYPGGTAPSGGNNTVLYDGANSRILYLFGRIPQAMDSDVITNRWWSLDIDGENANWNERTVGSEPPPRNFSAIAVDEEHSVAYFYGGFGPADAQLNDLWKFEYGAAGGERWTAMTAQLPEARIGGAMFFDGPRNRLVYAGGGPIVSEVPSLTADIFTLDLANPAATFVRDSHTLAHTFLGGAYSARGDQALLTLGIGTIDAAGITPYYAAMHLNLADLTSTESVVPSMGQSPLAGMWDRSPFNDGYVFTTRTIDGGGAGDLWTANTDLSMWAGVTVTGRDVPPALDSAVATIQRGALVMMGGSMPVGSRPTTGISDTVWTYTNGAWMKIAPGPGTPGARDGIVFDGSHPFMYARLPALLGRGTSGFLDDTVHRLDGTEWQTLPLRASSPPVRSRMGYVLFPMSCRGPMRGQVLGVAGGEAEDGSPMGETMGLECLNPSDRIPTDCVWFPPTTAAGDLPARSWSTASFDGQRSILLFGGLSRSAGMAFNDVFWMDYCVSPGMTTVWRTATVMGVRPMARWGHSASVQTRPGVMPTDPPIVDASVIFGGVTDPGGRNVMNDAWRMVSDGVDPTGTIYTVHFQSIPIDPSSELPLGRFRHIAVWDTTQNRLLVYGGRLDDRIILDDLWELRIR